MANVTGSLRVESFPFDSKADGYDADGYPVYDRAVGALTLRTVFRQFFTDGVFGTPADALHISKGDGGLRVNVAPGVFIVRGAMARVGDGDEPVTLTLSDTPPQGNVAYGIMLHYDENDTASIGRSLSLVAVAGEASSSAQPPAPDQSTPGIFEYRLGYVTVPSGATDLSGATVTNEKGLEVCPYAAPFDTIDVSAIVEDARNQAQEVTDAFLVYAQQYYDLIASAIDGTTAGMLMEMINNISAASFVDNVTLNLNSEAKAQIKSRAVKDNLIAIYGIHSEHMDNYLRQLLGILDPSSWAPGEFVSYVSDLDAEDQVSFINENMDGSTVSDWSASDVAAFDQALKSDAASIAFVSIMDLNQLAWGNLSGIVNAISHEAALSSFVAKEKSSNCGTYGTRSFRVIGVKHDDLSSGGKSALTFECTTNMMNVGDSNDHPVKWNGGSDPGNAAAWPICNLRDTVRDTVFPQLPSDLRSAIVTVKKRCTGGDFTTSNPSSRPDDSSLTKVDSNETVFLLSAYEIYGPNEKYERSSTRYYWAPPEGERYDYWASHKSQAALNNPLGKAGYQRCTRSWGGVQLVASYSGGSMGSPSYGSYLYATPAFCV